MRERNAAETADYAHICMDFEALLKYQNSRETLKPCDFCVPGSLSYPPSAISRKLTREGAAVCDCKAHRDLTPPPAVFRFDDERISYLWADKRNVICFSKLRRNTIAAAYKDNIVAV